MTIVPCVDLIKDVESKILKFLGESDLESFYREIEETSTTRIQPFLDLVENTILLMELRNDTHTYDYQFLFIISKTVQLNQEKGFDLSFYRILLTVAIMHRYVNNVKNYNYFS